MKNKILLTFIFSIILQFAWAIDVNNQNDLLDALKNNRTPINITADIEIIGDWGIFDKKLNKYISPSIQNVTINGGEHTIKMNTIDNPALIDIATNCTIQSLKLKYLEMKNPQIYSGGTFYIGSIANQLKSNSVINKCVAEFHYNISLANQGQGTNAYIGGIVAVSDGSTISNTISYFVNLSATFPNSSKGKFVTGGIAALIKNNSSLTNNVVTDLNIEGTGHKPGDLTIITGEIGNIADKDDVLIKDEETEKELDNNNTYIPPTEDNTNSSEKPSIEEIEDIIINNTSKINIYLNKQSISETGKGIALTVNNSDQTITISGTSTSSIILNENTTYNLVLNCNASIYCNKNEVNQLTIGGDVKQSGIISCKSLIMYDGCLISENQINNTGQILYYRQPQVWTKKVNNKGDGNGWETLYLPFEAKLAIEESDKRLFAYGDPESGGRYSYWLREFKGANPDGSLDFQYASTIMANTPYIISMPGSTWGSSISLENKTLVFIGTGSINGKSVIENPVNISFTSHPLTKATEAAGRLFLNSPAEAANMSGNELLGNEFRKIEETTSLPSFRATIEDNKNSSANLSSRKIVFGSNTTTQLTLNPFDNNEIAIHAFQGEIFIDSECPNEIMIYQISGIPVKKIRIEAGTTVISDLERGVYIIAGKKIVL